MVDLAQLELRIKSLEVAEAARNLDKLSASGKKAEQSAKGFGKGADQASKGAQRLKTGIGQAVRAMAPLIAAFASIAAARKAIKTISDFEYTLAQVRGVAIRTTETLATQEKQFRSLAAQARNLGAVTRYTATQAGEAQLFLARAGFEVHEILAALPGVLNLASAGVLDLGEAADIASNVLNQFRLNAEAMDHVGDVLVNTANRSNTTVMQLAEALKMAGPVAGALNKSLEETSAALGVMGDAGIQASLAGTQLRGIMAALLGPTPKAEKVLAKLAARLGETKELFDINTHSLKEIFQAFKDAGASAEDLNEIFSRRQVAGAILLSEYVDKLGELETSNKEVNDESQRMADIMNNTLKGAYLGLVSAVENLVLNSGDSGLTGALRGLVDLTTDVFRFLGGMEDKVKTNTTVVWALASALKTLIVVLGTLIAMKVALWIGGIVTGFKMASKAAGGFFGLLSAHPLTAFLTVLSAVTLAIIAFSSETSIAAEEQQNLKDKLTGMASELKQFDTLFAGMDRAIKRGDFVAEIEKKKQALKSLEEKIIDTIAKGENVPLELLRSMRIGIDKAGIKEEDLEFMIDHMIFAWAKETSKSGKIKDFQSLTQAFIKSGFALPKDEKELIAGLGAYYEKVLLTFKKKQKEIGTRVRTATPESKLVEDFKPDVIELMVLFKDLMKITELKPGLTTELLEAQFTKLSEAMKKLPETSGLKKVQDEIKAFSKTLKEATTGELGFEIEGIDILARDLGDLQNELDTVVKKPTRTALEDLQKKLLALENQFADVKGRELQKKMVEDNIKALQEEAKWLEKGIPYHDMMIERKKVEEKLDKLSIPEREKLLDIYMRDGLMVLKNAEDHAKAAKEKSDVVERALKDAKDAKDALDAMLPGLREEVKLIGMSAEDTEKYRIKQEALTLAKIAGIEKIDDYVKSLIKLIGEKHKAIKATQDQTEKEAKLIETLNEQKRALEQLEEGLKNQVQAFDDLKMTEDEAQIAAVRREFEKMGKAAGMSTNDVQKLGDAAANLEKWILAAERVREAFGSMGREIGQEFENILFERKNVEAAMQDLANSIEKMFFKMLVTDVLEQQLKSVAGSIMGSLGGNAAEDAVASAGATASAAAITLAGTTAGASLAAGGTAAGAAMITAATTAAGILSAAGGIGAGAGLAKGGVVSMGEIIPFAHGGLRQAAGGEVVNRPTFFPMKNGLGLMGEGRKAEGIFPLEHGSRGGYGVQLRVKAGNRFLDEVASLRRMPNGDLGLEADLGGGARRFQSGGVPDRVHLFRGSSGFLQPSTGSPPVASGPNKTVNFKQNISVYGTTDADSFKRSERQIGNRMRRMSRSLTE